MTNAIFQTPVCQLIELHNLFIELTAKNCNQDVYKRQGFCIFPTWAIVKITLIPFNIIIKSFSYFQLFLIPMSLFFTGSFFKRAA